MTGLLEAAPRERLGAPERPLLDRLYRAAWAMSGCPRAAEDLVEQAVARMRSWHRPRPDPTELMRALRDSHRASERRPPATDPAGDPSPATMSAIAALPEALRYPIVAVDMLGLSYREAAASLRTSQATIASRLFRARQRVAREVGTLPGLEPGCEPMNRDGG